MLDECKGERLEEVLAVFSNVVLKRAIQDNTTGRYEALAQQLALENFSYTGERTVLSALILAHKASLSKYLVEKNDDRAKYNNFSEILDQNDQRTTRRREELKDAMNEGERDIELSDRDSRLLQSKFRKNWSGSIEWLETILYGDYRPGREGLLLAKRFEIIWDQIENGTIQDIEAKNETGLIERLEARVQSQEARLARWQEFRRTLTRNGTKSPTKKAQAATVEQKGIKLGFNNHQALQIGKYTTESSKDTPVRDKYTRLIETTRNALDDVSKPKVLSKRTIISTVSRYKVIQPSTDMIEEPSFSTQQDRDLFPLLSNTAPESSSTPTVTSGGMGELANPHNHDPESVITPRFRISRRPVSTAKSSIIRPKQVPDNLEIATQRLSEATNFESDIGNRNIPTTESAIRSPHRPIPVDHDYNQDYPSVSIQTPPSIKRRHTTTSSLSRSTAQSSPSSQPALGSVPELSQAEQILNSMSAASPSPQKLKRSLSLAERTRLTMARSNPKYSKPNIDDEFDELPDMDRLTLNPRLQATPSKALSTEEEKHADLIERTRKSMAGFEAARKKAQAERRKSIKDEQRKQRQSHFPRAVHEEEPLPQATPAIDREVLMAEDNIDYASVFMSRPRIAVSPSPAKDRMISSMIESGDEENEDEDGDVTMAVDTDYANAFMSRPRIALSPTPASDRRRRVNGEGVNMRHDL